MPEFQAALKSLTSFHRLTFSSLATPVVSASKTLDQDSTTKEKVFLPYWNGFSQMMSDWLSLPTKIAYAGLASILSHGSAIGKNVKFWFSTKRPYKGLCSASWTKNYDFLICLARKIQHP
jgi:putative transposase